MPPERFDWAADTWLAIRDGKTDGDKFLYAGGEKGLKAAIRALFYDFHALMNNEISYKFQPAFIDGKFESLGEPALRELDALAVLMLRPDENFNELRVLWENNKKYRVLNSPLVGDWDTNATGEPLR